MAQNPAYGALTPRLAGTQRSDSQNIESVNASRQRNKFDYSNAFFNTLRFGEVRPFFHLNCLPQDSVSFNSKINLWTHTLKSPMMSGLRMYKDYFYVPMKAILPNGYDAWDTTPIQGDDIPSDAYCNFPYYDFCYLIYYYLGRCGGANSNHSAYTNQGILLLSLFAVYLFSNDNLLKSLGIDSTAVLGYKPKSANSLYDTFDQAFETILSIQPDSAAGITGTLPNNTLRAYNVFVSLGSDTYGVDVPVFRQLLFDVLFNGVRFSSTQVTAGTKAVDYISKSVFDAMATVFNVGISVPPVLNMTFAKTLDFCKLYAYQMIGSQFYVRDDVDVVYTAPIWLDNQLSLAGTINLSGSTYRLESYDYNGSNRYYDVLSLHTIADILKPYQQTEGPSSLTDAILLGFPFDFFFNLFLPFESLRFGDYLVGSRLSPLAVGADTMAQAPVVANNVKAVDLVSAMASMSYFNDVMKLGPTEWIQKNGIYGDFPVSLDPMPRFISRERVDIGQMDIENTGENQGNIVSRIRSTDGGYAFACNIKEDSVILGLCSFDIPRVYENITERQAFIKDRYDRFNPYFQNIGDQAVYSAEVDLSQQPDDDEDFDAIAWQIRNTEYKQRLSVAAGGFIGNTYLPSWIFSTNCRGLRKLTSEFIRNHNEEFDRFYVSLQNLSFAGYFHFYVKFQNGCELVRAMQAKPSIQLPMIHQ